MNQTSGNPCNNSSKYYQKLRQMTKQDKQHITKILETSTEGKNDNWVNLLETIDIECMKRSLSQILNSPFDKLPDQLINSNPYLSSIKKAGRTITIMDVISNSDTVFRFAPAPSGYLHIGHIVPILLNVLLRSVSKRHNKKSDIIFRIDDTNPSEDDFSENIKLTIIKLLGSSFDSLIKTRSSDFAPKIIELIDDSIMKGDDKYYVDESDTTTIHVEREKRLENSYRKLNLDSKKNLWSKMKSGELMNAVVRAKIDMSSDNGNLRDPVVLRYVEMKESKQSKQLMPTYDLVCPVLDSLDAMNLDNTTLTNRISIALRDCNYYDRLEQYYWIQDSFNLKPTALVTFSRVNFKNVLLSKRKIKKLIENNYVDSWDDPRLMTIDSMLNRGMTLSGMINFYWLTGHISLGNRATSQDISTLFELNDKVLSQRNNFIVDRELVIFDLTDNYNKYMIISIKEVRAKHTDVEHDSDSLKIPDMVHIKDLFSLKKRLISHNIRLINDLITKNNLDKTDLDRGDELISQFKLSPDNFKTCLDVRIGDTIKINNFKDLNDDPDFGGYYYVVSKDECMFKNHNMNRINVIHIA